MIRNPINMLSGPIILFKIILESIPNSQKYQYLNALMVGILSLFIL